MIPPATQPATKPPADPMRIIENRRHVRLTLPAAYTLIRVRLLGDDRYRWTGYIYDISESGLRFELDHGIDPGTPVELRAMLPGYQHTTFCATGRVVRLHDDPDEPGPVRMGLAFESFRHDYDRQRLKGYLEQGLTAASRRQAA